MKAKHKALLSMIYGSGLRVSEAEILAGHRELARKLFQLERKLGDHDEQIIVLVEASKQLMDPQPPPKTRRTGFNAT